MRLCYRLKIFARVAALSLTGCTAAGIVSEHEASSEFDASAPVAATSEPAEPRPAARPLSACLATEPSAAERVADPGPANASDTSDCPHDMVLVEGNHCPNVEQKCSVWIEDPFKNPYARCRVFEAPTLCKAEKVPLRFCIDRLEAAGDNDLPLADKSWTEAKSLCEAQGKRLCQETEWLFACEGEEALPYPYGFVRNSDLCNFERTEDLVTNKGKLADHRQPVTANPYCVSPFGVQNMVGNIDEWVVLDTPHYSAKNNWRKMQSGLKGGWWGPLRNRCRPTTVDHDEVFHELQTGFRCCKDAP